MCVHDRTSVLMLCQRLWTSRLDAICSLLEYIYSEAHLSLHGGSYFVF